MLISPVPRAIVAPIPHPLDPEVGLSDFPLTLVGAGLAGGWRPDPGFFSLSSGKFTQVDDRSGNGLHATQGGASMQRPTLVADARNGKPAMSFAGNQRMAVAAPVIGIDNCTIFCVHAPDSVTTARTIFSSGASGGLALVLNAGGEGKRNAYLKAVGVVSDGSAALSAESLVLTRRSGVLHLYVNGVEVALDAPSIIPAGVIGNSTLGALINSGTFHYSGLIFELWCASSAFTAAQALAYHQSAAARYAL